VAIVVFVVLSFLANIETKWIKAEIKGEAKELRKLRREVEELLSKEKNEKASVPKPGIAGADGL
jgi:cell division protein FtsL